MFVLATTVGWGGMLPVVARVLIGVDHICHCKASEHDCVCVRCQPDRVDLWLAEESVKGQCGDDDAFPSAEGVRMLGSAPFVVTPPPCTRIAAKVVAALRLDEPPRSPPVPPPRVRRAARTRSSSS